MRSVRKKRGYTVLVGVGLAVVLAVYILSQYLGGTQTTVAVATTPITQSKSGSIPSSSQTTQQPTNGLYANGSYTGSPADAYYGNVQVQAVIRGGALASVQILQYPSDHQASQYINSQALPLLQSEAIQSQNSNVNIISGATFTSQAFQQSLASALTQAQH